MSGERRTRGSSADVSVGLIIGRMVKLGCSTELRPYPEPSSRLKLRASQTDSYQNGSGAGATQASRREGTTRGGAFDFEYENHSPGHESAVRESPGLYGSCGSDRSTCAAGGKSSKAYRNDVLRSKISEAQRRLKEDDLEEAERESLERRISEWQRELKTKDRSYSDVPGVGHIHAKAIARHRHLKSIFTVEHTWPAHSVVPHGPSLAHPPDDPPYPRIYRELIIVSSAMFMGYGALVAFQHKLFDAYRTNSKGVDWDTNKELLKHGAVMNYIGNLAFRFLHNVFLACASSRQRVTLSLWAMALSMFMLGFCVYWPLYTTWVPVVYLAYLLGGAAIGTFETNILSCVTPLGHDSKLWAMLGIPIGFSAMSVGGMFAAGAGLPVEWLYYTTAIMSVISVFLFVCFVPAGEYQYDDEERDIEERKGLNDSQESAAPRGRGFVAQMGEWRVWGPIIFWPALARAVCMFFLTFFSSFNLYTIPTIPGNHGHDIVPIATPFNEKHVSFMRVSFYLAILNIMQLIGDTVSRKLAYLLPLCNPVIYCVWSVIGGIMCYFCDPILTWVGTMFIFLANGAIYSNSVKRIDTGLEDAYARRLNLVAVSMWLLLGDIGSVVGSNTWQFFTG